MLPSKVLTEATTIDLWVFDVASSYRKLQQDRQQDPLAGYDKQQLADAIKQRKANNEHSETDN